MLSVINIYVINSTGKRVKYRLKHKHGFDLHLLPHDQSSHSNIHPQELSKFNTSLPKSLFI